MTTYKQAYENTVFLFTEIVNKYLGKHEVEDIINLKADLIGLKAYLTVEKKLLEINNKRTD